MERTVGLFQLNLPIQLPSHERCLCITSPSYKLHHSVLIRCGFSEHWLRSKDHVVSIRDHPDISSCEVHQKASSEFLGVPGSIDIKSSLGDMKQYVNPNILSSQCVNCESKMGTCNGNNQFHAIFTSMSVKVTDMR